MAWRYLPRPLQNCRQGGRMRVCVASGHLAPLLAPEGAIGRLVAERPGPGTRPVRGLLFDKSDGSNWALGWNRIASSPFAHDARCPATAPGRGRQAFLGLDT